MTDISELAAKSGVAADAAATVLERAGRTALLSWLRERGVQKLSDRQALANALSRALKAGQIQADRDAPIELSHEDPTTRVLRAAAAGDVGVVRDALMARPPPALTDTRSGRTALMAAAANGRDDLVELLLRPEHASAVGAVDQRLRDDGDSALALAVRHGRSGCVRLLLHGGADADAASHGGWSPLMTACEAGRHELVELLLANRASPTQGLHNGWAVMLTPLKLACLGGQAECVRRLLVAGAHIVCREEGGGSFGVLEPDGSTLLLYAVTARRTASLVAEEQGPSAASVVALLLAANAALQLESTRWDGLTPLAYAAMHGDFSSARLLLDAGARVSRADEVGWTPLCWAAACDRADCVALLLERLASADEARPNGSSALRLASLRAPNGRCASLLLEARATPLAATLPSSPVGATGRSDLRFRRPEELSHLDHWLESWLRARRPAAAAAAPPLYHCSSSHPHFANLLQVLLLAHGFGRAEHASEGWRLMWCAGRPDTEVLRHLAAGRLVNKLPGSSCLTNKLEMWAMVERTQRRHGKQELGFVPPSFVLPRDRDALRARMAEQAADDEAANSAAIWIVKPAAACRGLGISLHRASDGLPDELAARRAIASMYIHPPYLIEGRKVDLRLYVLMTSVRPLVLYLHRQGFARLASDRYDPSDLANDTSHLTNYAINKRRPTREGGEGGEGDDGALGPKISLDAFGQRLARDVGAERAAICWSAIDDAIARLCQAAAPQCCQAAAASVPRGGGRCFQLLGFDVLLDAACNPWILEVNADPSLATDSPLDLSVKAAVLTDLLNVLEVGGGGDGDGVEAEFERAAQGGWRRPQAHPSAGGVT